MMTDSENKLIDFKFLTLTCLVGVINSFFCLNFTVMLVLLIFELAVLLFCVYNKDWVGYLKFYLVFLCFSMESSSYVGAEIFYGFKNFRLLGLNVAVWMLIPLFLKSIFDFSWQKKIESIFLRKLLWRLFFFTFFGFFMGCINYLLDDNGFASKNGSLGVFVNILYSFLLPLILIISTSWVVYSNKNRLNELKQALFSVVVSLAIVFLSCLFLKNYGNRGGLPSLQVSEVYFIAVVAITMIAYPQIKLIPKIILFISGFVILVLSLTFNTNGKIIIASFLIPVVMLFIAKMNGIRIRAIIISIIAIPLIALFFYNHLENQKNNILLSEKNKQVSGLLAFSSDNWFENIPSSPKMRLTEFLNISSELIESKKILFGKGFAGTIKDNGQYFDNISEFSFSKWELELGAYYSMHESINCFFLVGGLFGLGVLLSILFGIVKIVHKSPWLIIGFFWLLLFYNYHMTIAIYGIVSLIVGICDSERNQQISLSRAELCK